MMQNLERLIYVDKVLRSIIWVEYLGRIHHDVNKYWYEVINFGKGMNNFTGEIEHIGIDPEGLIAKLQKKVNK